MHLGSAKQVAPCLLALPCRVVGSIESLNDYKEALLYGNEELGLTGSILVVSAADCPTTWLA